jgi:hypothetical protein
LPVVVSNLEHLLVIAEYWMTAAECRSEHMEEMIAAFHTETDEWVRTMLFWPIIDARLPQALSFLQENLYSDNPHLRELAIRELKLLDTHESRTALWDARNHSFNTEQETQDFRLLLSS